MSKNLKIVIIIAAIVLVIVLGIFVLKNNLNIFTNNNVDVSGENNEEINENISGETNEKVSGENLIEKVGKDFSGEYIYLPSAFNINTNYPEVKLNTEEELVEHYKLSDSYFLEGEEDKDSITILDSNEIINEKYNFVSDGINVRVECSRIDDDSVDVTVNNLPLMSNDGISVEDEYIKDTIFSSTVEIIDLDVKDNYKEILIYTISGNSSGIIIYRVKSKGLEEIFEYDLGWESFLKVNDKYVLSEDFYTGDFRFPFGYYIYEDGVFKHIDRFATGEKITNDKGEINENFKKLIFTTDKYYEGASFEKEINGETLQLKSGTKFSFVGYRKNENNWSVYDIKIIDDTYWVDYLYDNVEPIKAGTIIKDVEAELSW